MHAQGHRRALAERREQSNFGICLSSSNALDVGPGLARREPQALAAYNR